MWHSHRWQCACLWGTANYKCHNLFPVIFVPKIHYWGQTKRHRTEASMEAAHCLEMHDHNLLCNSSLFQFPLKSYISIIIKGKKWFFRFPFFEVSNIIKHNSDLSVALLESKHKDRARWAMAYATVDIKWNFMPNDALHNLE